MRIILSIVFVSIFAICVSAQQQSKKSEIIESYKGESWYMHYVMPGETVQSLATLYNVTNVEIYNSNPEIAAGLQPHKVIRIPVKSKGVINYTIQQDTTQRSGKGTTHVVQPKETWYSIARQYELPVNELIKANPGIEVLQIGMNVTIPGISEATKVITGGYAEHTVMPQETLYSLAKKYNTTVDELKRLNPSVVDGLKVSQVLMVPASTAGDEVLKVQVTDTVYVIHQIGRKETLYGLSKQYNVEQNDILKANPDFDGKLRKGDFIRIPRYTKEVRPFVKPDTTIMGREIDRLATGSLDKRPCSSIPDNKSQYNIAMLVPMQLELVDSISVSDPKGLKSAPEYTSFDFIQFYEGAVIAADSMAAKGMNVKVHVFDADYGDEVGKTRRILNKPEMAKMDLIIGPFFAESFDLVAEFAKTHKIPIVNPLSRRTELVKNNEYIIKMQPTPWAQYNTLTRYIKTAHSNDNIILVRRNAEENNSMANVIKSTLSADTRITYNEIIYSVNGWSGISKSLSSSKANVVILLINDKAILPAILRDLSYKATDMDIAVVGLPEWESMELDYDYLMKLKTHFFKPWFVDYSSPAIKNFIKKYRERYAGEPEVDRYAYLGYDATLYFLTALHSYGKNFVECLEDFRSPGLSNNLIFMKSQDGGFENYGTTIFKYHDFTRQKLN